MMTIRNNVLDYAILGSSSGHYGWKEVKFCDFDIWVLCNSISDKELLLGIRSIINDIKATVENENIVLFAGAYNGPYKPAIWRIDSKDILFLHFLIDDMESFNERSVFTKLSWSKYSAHNNKKLLKTLLDRVPTEYDLLHSRCGILRTLDSLQRGVIKYNQINLSTGLQMVVEYDRESAQYIEFILHSVMMISRNRARLSNQKEADCLENLLFAEWYEKTYGDSFVRFIAEYKARVSNCGYGVIESISVLEKKVICWLIELKNETEEIND